MYIYELPDWPSLTLDQSRIIAPLLEVRHHQGRLLGRMEILGFTLQDEAVLKTLTVDVVKSSEIEGEILDSDQVRSSLARRLGIDIGSLPPVDRHVEGIVEMMLDATRNYAAPLTPERLWAWHAALFPTSYSGLLKIRTGVWRDDAADPMRVVSGYYGREHVHYQAPAAELVPQEMAGFLTWFNEETSLDPVLKAGVAHLWFLTIHPFDDGNGRIGRAIADMALARSEKSPQRFYSLSGQIRLERQAYYKHLEMAQKGETDITPWLEWFLGCLNRAIDGAQDTLGAVLGKAKFWETHAASDLNERQRKILNRLLDGFEGKMTSTKWAIICKCSHDTANRDIRDLIEKGILHQSASGGRSTSYTL